MTNYERGVRLEREVQQIFKNAGYEAIRTAGSHSPYDVILIKYTKGPKGHNKKICFVSFVQCKVQKVKGSDVGDTCPERAYKDTHRSVQSCNSSD